MFENFEVNPVFEGQAREHPHFSLQIQGQEYKGMVRDGKVRWYHPHPKQTIEQEYLSKVESEVFEMMKIYQDL